MAEAATPSFDYANAIKTGYQLWSNNVSAGTARTTAADSSQNWTDQMNNAETGQKALSGLISSLGSVIAGTPGRSPAPSGASGYVDAAKAGAVAPQLMPSARDMQTSSAFKNISASDRATMLAAYGQAQDAAGRRVDINGYNTDNVRQIADRKYSGAVGGVDRAATIASSQGFAKALNGGMADSTAAATQSNTLSRDFADLYAKLRSESDAAALAENQSEYKSYLEGQGLQVDQNSKVASALNNTYSTAASKSANADNTYSAAMTNDANRLQQALTTDANVQATALTNDAARVQNALQNQDTVWNNAATLDANRTSGQQTLLSNLYNIYGSNQNSLVDSAYKRYSTDAGNATADTKAAGSAQSNLLDTVLNNATVKSLIGKVGQPAVDAVNKLIGAGVTKVGDVVSGLFSGGLLSQAEAEQAMQSAADQAGASPDVSPSQEEMDAWVSEPYTMPALQSDLPSGYAEDEDWLNWSM